MTVRSGRCCVTRSRFVFGFSALVASTAGPLQVQAQTTESLRVSTRISPSAPRVGPADIDVLVLGSDGRPVSGAMVEILASMPAMSMGTPMPMQSQGMLGPKLHVLESGNGHYHALVNLNHAVLWTFVVHASAKGAYGTGTFSVHVKP